MMIHKPDVARKLFPPFLSSCAHVPVKALTVTVEKKEENLVNWFATHDEEKCSIYYQNCLRFAHIYFQPSIKNTIKLRVSLPVLSCSLFISMKVFFSLTATELAQGELNHKINRKIAVDCFPIRHRLSEGERKKATERLKKVNFLCHFTDKTNEGNSVNVHRE